MNINFLIMCMSRESTVIENYTKYMYLYNTHHNMNESRRKVRKTLVLSRSNINSSFLIIIIVVDFIILYHRRFIRVVLYLLTDRVKSTIKRKQLSFFITPFLSIIGKL